MRRRGGRLAALVMLGALTWGCAAGRAFQRAEQSAQEGDWDMAVAHYRQAVQEAPNRTDYRIALERAQRAAAAHYADRAAAAEARGQFDAALLDYRRAVEYDPSHRQAALRAAEIERTIREQIEAARPRPPIQEMRERARQVSPEAILDPASREPLTLRFTNARLGDVLNFIASATGINITYDQQFQAQEGRPYTVNLEGVTLEQALNQILSANQLFYKVVNERTIIVVPDTPQKRAQYEEQVIRTFYLSHADPQEVSQLINSVIRVPQMPVQPSIAVNKTANAITIRATASVAAIIERIIRANDKPLAEIVIDVEILEVSRTRAKQLGLNLSQYSLGLIFSPEQAPGDDGTVPPFNLNTISQGVSTADFYAAVPTALVRFLETDSQTRVIAKPQLRGAEGTPLSLHLGDEVPVPSTVFTPFATGGVATNPMTSFVYRPVGVNVQMTPRVTYEGEIILELEVESSTIGRDFNIAGQNLPSFGSRRVVTRLRLREGEANLLAGLLREDERRSLRGFPGLMRLPVLRQLFSSTDDQIEQTDVVMLLTPRIVRSHELTQEDLDPIYIGTQQNLGLTGPPPLIGLPAGDAPAGEPAQPEEAGAPAPDPAPAGAPAAAPPALPADLSPTPGGMGRSPQILVMPSTTELRVGGGPYTVPISISGASQLSVVTLTLTFDPAVVRVQGVQEGSFMRQGGVDVAFVEEVEAASGRVDLTLTRVADAVGAAGSGLLAAILFEAVAPGSSTLSLSGVATTPSGSPVPLQFSPVSVTVR